MEPGHEDREYAPHEPQAAADDGASMEPGHEDREYHDPVRSRADADSRLNGARS